MKKLENKISSGYNGITFQTLNYLLCTMIVDMFVISFNLFLFFLWYVLIFLSGEKISYNPYLNVLKGLSYGLDKHLKYESYCFKYK